MACRDQMVTAPRRYRVLFLDHSLKLDRQSPHDLSKSRLDKQVRNNHSCL
jgi:hypothetical protein